MHRRKEVPANLLIDRGTQKYEVTPNMKKRHEYFSRDTVPLDFEGPLGSIFLKCWERNKYLYKIPSGGVGLGGRLMT